MKKVIKSEHNVGRIKHFIYVWMTWYEYFCVVDFIIFFKVEDQVAWSKWDPSIMSGVYSTYMQLFFVLQNSVDTVFEWI